MKIFITDSEEVTLKDFQSADFFSLRSAMMWAKQKGMTELYLTRMILKKGDKKNERTSRA